MAVETQSMLDDNEEHHKLYSEVRTALLAMQEIAAEQQE